MHTRQRQLPITWFCLLWFVLCNTVFASGLVHCRDGHGESRIEWGCSRSAAGDCLADEDADHESEAPKPCQDTPISGDQPAMAKAPPRNTGDFSASWPTLATVPDLWAPEAASRKVVSIRTVPSKPPDATGHLRTVILLV